MKPLDQQNEPIISMMCYVMLPLKMCNSPLKLSPPFLTEMAKGARIAQILSRIPVPSSCLQSVMIMQ